MALTGFLKLNVTLAGKGSGTVVGTSPYVDIDCGTKCSTTVTAGNVIDLREKPGSAAIFAGWSGDCTGMGACSICTSSLPPPYGCPTKSTYDVQARFEPSLAAHYYEPILDRTADPIGKAFWESESIRATGLGMDATEAWFAMAQAFFGSDEYAAFKRDNTGFVMDLYNTFFNRAPDSAGLAFWVGQLDSGMPREVLLAAFMFSTEFTDFANAMFGSPSVRAEINAVGDFYRGLLGRLPDEGGFGLWVGKFRIAQCAWDTAGGAQAAVHAEVESISSQFALSNEYTAMSRTNAQYVGDLYNAFLRRGGDLEGVQYWIDQIASNVSTREQVRQAFVASPEFQARVAAIIGQGCAYP